MPLRLQEVIYKYELGAAGASSKYAAAVIAMIGLAVWYDTTAFRNLSTQEGMDAAQLARKLSEGKGFATDFIRPFSLGLLRKHSLAQRPAAAPRAIGPTNAAATVATLDVCRLNQLHPDLANPPLYPLLLAGALKLMPFGYPDLPANPTKSFTVYLPDLWIAMFNQLLLLSRRSWSSAWRGSYLMNRWRGCPPRFPGRGFVLAVQHFRRVNPAVSHPLFRTGGGLGEARKRVARTSAHSRRLFILAGRRGFGGSGRSDALRVWMAHRARALHGRLLAAAKPVALTLTAVVAFLAVMTPWLVRNHALSGAPFGTAGFAIYQNTPHFFDDELERSLAPDFSTVSTAEFSRKPLLNAKEIIQHDLPGWAAVGLGLFSVGLLVPFRSPTLGRVRLFVVLCSVSWSSPRPWAEPA